MCCKRSLPRRLGASPYQSGVGRGKWGWAEVRTRNIRNEEDPKWNENEYVEGSTGREMSQQAIINVGSNETNDNQTAQVTRPDTIKTRLQAHTIGHVSRAHTQQRFHRQRIFDASTDSTFDTRGTAIYAKHESRHDYSYRTVSCFDQNKPSTCSHL